MYEVRLKIILLLQVSSHDFEPTFIILVLIGRTARPAQIKTNHNPLTSNKHVSLLYFCLCMYLIADNMMNMYEFLESIHIQFGSNFVERFPRLSANCPMLETRKLKHVSTLPADLFGGSACFMK